MPFKSSLRPHTEIRLPPWQLDTGLSLRTFLSVLKFFPKRFKPTVQVLWMFTGSGSCWAFYRIIGNLDPFWPGALITFAVNALTLFGCIFVSLFVYHISLIILIMKMKTMLMVRRVWMPQKMNKSSSSSSLHMCFDNTNAFPLNLTQKYHEPSSWLFILVLVRHTTVISLNWRKKFFCQVLPFSRRNPTLSCLFECLPACVPPLFLLFGSSWAASLSLHLPPSSHSGSRWLDNFGRQPSTTVRLFCLWIFFLPQPPPLSEFHVQPQRVKQSSFSWSYPFDQCWKKFSFTRAKESLFLSCLLCLFAPFLMTFRRWPMLHLL